MPALLCVITHGPVASHKLLVPALPLAGVPECSIFRPLIDVAVEVARPRVREDQDIWRFPARVDPVLAATAVLGMEI